MTAYKCDRCGKLFDEKEIHPHAITVCSWETCTGWEAKDLCDNCRKQLEDWWNDKDVVIKAALKIMEEERK